MTPEAGRFLEKAGKPLADADTMLGVGLTDAAGRTTYLAGFHVAQALIFERTGKSSKTHNGVQREFLRLTKDDPAFGSGLRTFLSRTYNLKSIADYETGAGSEVSTARAATAIELAKRFVWRITTHLTASTT